MKRTGTKLIPLLLLLICNAWSGTLYTANGFETPSYVVGLLNGQQNWFGDNANVQTAIVSTGAQAVQLVSTNGNNAAMAPPISGDTTSTPAKILRLSVDAQLAIAANPDFWTFLSLRPAGVNLVALNVDQTGTVMLHDGVTNHPTTIVLARNVWSHFDLVVNYSNRSLAAYVNGVQAMTASFGGTSGAWTIPGSYSQGFGVQQGYFDNYTISSTTVSAAPGVSLSAPLTSVYGQQVALTATVTFPGSTGSPQPGGTVTFYDGVNVLGTVPLSNGTASLATILLSAIAGGTRTLRAQFNGNSDYVAASGTAVEFVVVQPSSGYAPSTFPLQYNPAKAVVGDFNGDGLLDLIAATSLTAGNYLDYLQGNGAGTLTPAVGTGLPLPIGSDKLLRADFNGDGKPDVAFIGAGNAQLLLSDGSGLVPVQTGPAIDGVVADFNGDGNADLALQGPVAGTSRVLSIYPGNGDGTFRAPLTLSFSSTGAGSITVADFNNDGKPDLAITADAVYVLLGRGDGSFQPPVQYFPNAGLGPIMSADINGDGRPDLVTTLTFNSATTLIYFLGNGDGTFQSVGTIAMLAEPPFSILAGDFNGDGRQDLLAAGPNGFSLLLGNGNGTFLPQTRSAFSSITDIQAGDFNGDGRPDLAVIAGGTLYLGLAQAPVAGLPAITAFSPTSVPAGSAAFTLNLNGTNFCAGSSVVWNSTSLVTTYYSSASITAAVPAGLLTIPATASLSVTNPPGAGCGTGGVSPAVSFVVAAISSPQNPGVTIQPPLLRPSAPSGSTVPVMNTVNIRNVNGAPLTAPIATSVFIVSGGTNWLTVIPQTTADLYNGTLRFTVNPAGLADGSYLAYIVYPGLSTAGGFGAGIAHPRPRATTPQCDQASTAVVFTKGNPLLTFSPLNPMLSAGGGGAPSDTINVTVNELSAQGASQAIPIEVTPTSSDGAGGPCWLSIAPLNVALQTGTPFQATASAANLPAGTHIGGLSVTSGGQSASDAVVFTNTAPGNQFFDVGANPVMSIDPNMGMGSILVGSNPSGSPLTFTATCEGCAGLTFTATCSGCPGATPGAIGGMTPVILVVSLTNPSLFVPGKAVIMISSPGAPTVGIPVTLAVQAISEVLDAAGFRSTLVPGEWAAIFGNNLSTATGPWGPSDFPNGTTLLPTSLSGVSVAFNGIAAPVYYVSPTQINVQVPAGLNGSVPVVVTTSGGLLTQAFNAMVAANAPALFTYPVGNNNYAGAQHNGGALIGDPAVEPGTTKAKPGETIVIYVNGLAASPSGMEVAGIPYTASPVTVSFNSTSVTATYAGVSFAGGFQVNVVVPASLKPGNYALTVSTLGQSSQPGVIIPVGP